MQSYIFEQIFFINIILFLLIQTIINISTDNVLTIDKLLLDIIRYIFTYVEIYNI